MIEASPFGNLVTSSESGLEATGLPIIIDRERGDLGTLSCHMARSNRQWQRIDGADTPDGYIDRQLRAIVGVEIKVIRLEGKRKLSQNRSDDDRLGVVRGLAESQRNSDRSLAEAMRSTTDSDNKSHL